MLSAMNNGPAAALRARSALKLSAEQRTKLEALERRLGEASKPGVDSMQAIHAQLTLLAAQPTFDEPGARVAFDRMARVHTEMGLAMPMHGMPTSGMPMHPMSGRAPSPKP